MWKTIAVIFIILGIIIFIKTSIQYLEHRAELSHKKAMILLEMRHKKEMLLLDIEYKKLEIKEQDGICLN